jgi:N-acetylglutamate synthase-like GNAT family acetyltransferase
MLEDTPVEWARGDHRITTDRSAVMARLPEALALLRVEHWGGGLDARTLERAARNSICFAMTASDRLVGFARAVSDLATYAYLTDVVIAPDARGSGLGAWLVECILSHPDLQGLRRVALLTRDAPALYERAGFVRCGPFDGYVEDPFSIFMMRAL